MPDPSPENPQEIYKPGKPVGVERSNGENQLAYVVGHRQFVDQRGNKPVSGVVVAFLDGKESTPSIKLVPYSEIKPCPLFQVGKTLGLLETTLPFQENETPTQRLLGPNNSDNLVLYLEETDQDPYLRQAQLVRVSTYDNTTGQRITSPSQVSKVTLLVGGQTQDFSYQECLVLQSLRQKALQGDDYPIQTTSSETNGQIIQPNKTIKDKPRLGFGVNNIVVGGRSWVGERSVDEDSILVTKDPRTVHGKSVDIAVFDGMGGHGNGDEASKLAMMAYQQAVSDGKSPTEAIYAANDKVFQFNKSNGLDSGSTIVVARIHSSGQVEVAHVGDSRAYLVGQNGTVDQLTKDHSLVRRLVDAGQITPDQARTHPQRNVIYRSLGSKASVEVEIGNTTLQSGQAIMVACDGLEDMLNSPPQGVEALSLQTFINRVATKNRVPIHQITSQMIWDELVSLHNQSWGSPDNVSFVWATRST